MPTINTSDSVTLAESSTVQLNPLLINKSDSLTITESASLLLGIAIHASESITITESTVEGINKFVHAFDSLTITESATPRQSALGISVSDSITIAEFVSFTFGPGRAIPADSLIVTERVEIEFFAAQVSQAASGSEIQFLCYVVAPDTSVERYTDADTLGVNVVPTTADNWLKGLWKKRILGAPTTAQNWSDVLYGVTLLNDGAITFDNSRGDFQNWYDSDYEGQEIRLVRWDRSNNTFTLEIIGVITQVEFGDVVQVAYTSVDTDLLDKEFPEVIVATEDFPNAFSDALGLPIAEPWGFGRYNPLRLINVIEDEDLTTFVDDGEVSPVYDYIIRGNVGIPTVYRDGVKADVGYKDGIDVQDTGYKVDNAGGHNGGPQHPGYTIVRFYTRQRTNGREHKITADTIAWYPDINGPVATPYAIIADWKFNTSLRDTSGNQRHFDGTDIVFQDFRAGYPAYRINAIDFNRSSQRLVCRNDAGLRKTQFAFRLVCSINGDSDGRSIGLAGGPGDSSWAVDKLSTTGCFIRWTVSTSSGTKTLTTNDIGYDVFHDLVFICYQDASFLRHLQIWVDGLMVAEQTMSGDPTYPGSFHGIVLNDGSFGWRCTYANFKDLSLAGGSDTAAKAPILPEYRRFTRNGITYIRNFLSRDYFSTYGSIDETLFETAEQDWADINGGSGLPVDYTLIEATKVKDVLDAILILRGGRIFRTLGLGWGVELDKIRSQDGIPVFEEGSDKKAQHIATGLTFPRDDLSKRVKHLFVDYRPREDPSGGDGIAAYMFQQDKDDLNTRGQDLIIPLNAVYDHLSAAIFLAYFSKRLISASRQTAFTLPDPAGRTMVPSKLFKLLVPRFNITNVIHQVTSAQRAIEQYQLTAMRYDPTSFDALVDPELPDDPEEDELPNVPDITNWWAVANAQSGIIQVDLTQRVLGLIGSEAAIHIPTLVGAASHLDALQVTDDGNGNAIIDDTSYVANSTTDELYDAFNFADLPGPFSSSDAIIIRMELHQRLGATLNLQERGSSRGLLRRGKTGQVNATLNWSWVDVAWAAMCATFTTSGTPVLQSTGSASLASTLLLPISMSGITSGSSIFVQVVAKSTGTPPTVIDSGGNTYQLVGSVNIPAQSGSADGRTLYLYATFSVASAPLTITVGQPTAITPPSTTAPPIAATACAFTNVVAKDRLRTNIGEQANAIEGDVIDSLQTAPLTSYPQLVLGFFGVRGFDATGFMSPGAGYTFAVDGGIENMGTIYTEYKTVASVDVTADSIEYGTRRNPGFSTVGFLGVDFYDVFSSDPDGAAIYLSDLPDLQVGIALQASGGNGVKCSSLWTYIFFQDPLKIPIDFDSLLWFRNEAETLDILDAMDDPDPQTDAPFQIGSSLTIHDTYIVDGHIYRYWAAFRDEVGNVSGLSQPATIIAFISEGISGYGR